MKAIRVIKVDDTIINLVKKAMSSQNKESGIYCFNNIDSTMDFVVKVVGVTEEEVIVEIRFCAGIWYCGVDTSITLAIPFPARGSSMLV